MGKAIQDATQNWRDKQAAALRAKRIAKNAADITADTLQARARRADLPSGDPRDETALAAKLRLRDNAQLDVQIAKLETEREALDKRIAFLRSSKRP